MTIHGRARVLGDDVNTDYIISSSRKRETIDPRQLAPYLLEGVSPEFAASVRPRDVLVAGRNFGCGSAMEVAVTVIQAAGINAVVARSFARSFFRNAINNGLPVIECDIAGIAEGDEIAIDLGAGKVTIAARNITRTVPVLPPAVQSILNAGGLIAFLQAHPDWKLA